MLTQLYIENIAVIEKATIDFQSGFTILTGETGAGKSMIIDAIHAILGERTSKDIIRNGASSAYVSAMFQDVPISVRKTLQDLGYEVEENNSLLIQRMISLEGKTACKLNGRPATVSTLKQIAPMLIHIHGQHESYFLLSMDLHGQYIDKMGELEGTVKEYQSAYHKMKQIRDQWKACQMDEAEKARKMDLLQYQIQELEQADIQVGEWEELIERKNGYLHRERIMEGLFSAKRCLEGEPEETSTLDAIQEAIGALESIEEHFPAIHSCLERLQDVRYALEDAQEELRDVTNDIEYQPEELEQIEERLDQLYRLSRKYGDSEEAMLKFLEECRTQWQQIQLSEEHLQKLMEEYEAAKEQAIALARTLSQKRKQTIEWFAKQVKFQLQFLNMPGVRFAVSQERVPLQETGCDKMEFLISTNPGEPLKPLAKIASGGELSRIMLAIKTVLAEKDETHTLIFDEVDTGISGQAAQKVGLKLKEVSKHRQVICITHLAQIASLADHHFLIQKEIRQGKTFTMVKPLDWQGRVAELARIMGGEPITALMLQNAEEMLRSAQS